MTDRVVVITGASAGIGAALAEHLGARGGRLVLVARREAALAAVAARSGPEVLTVVADVTRRADMVRTVDVAMARFGRIDAWVNNAGRGITRPVSELTDEDVDDMMLMNLKSALYGIQAVLPHMKERGAGHIVNVSSMLGRVPLAHPRSAYSASKAALNQLTGSLRLELRDSHPGIAVSTVSPGVVATDFGTNARHGGMDSRKLPNAQPVEQVAAAIAECLETRAVDVYTFPGAREMVAGYFSAPDMAAAEQAFGRR